VAATVATTLLAAVQVDAAGVPQGPPESITAKQWNNRITDVSTN
jgi:hypothetical protein